MFFGSVYSLCYEPALEDASGCLKFWLRDFALVCDRYSRVGNNSARNYSSNRATCSYLTNAPTSR